MSPDELRLQAAWIAEGLAGPLAEALVPLLATRLRQHPTIERIAYSPDECAEAMGVGRDKVYALLRSGDLPSVRLAGRRLIRVEALAQFMERAESETATAVAAEQQQLLPPATADTPAASRHAGGRAAS